MRDLACGQRAWCLELGVIIQHSALVFLIADTWDLLLGISPRRQAKPFQRLSFSRKTSSALLGVGRACKKLAKQKTKLVV